MQVVPLYNGGRYSAYAFRRFTDIRLVAAAELNMGFFGDPDNFTYPRYALDFAFYRVYVDGEPYTPSHWYTWGDGVKDGEPVFVIGNPGPTNRLQTVAQLEYQRDVLVPVRKSYFETRLAALRAEEILGLKRAAEGELLAKLAVDPALNTRYGSVVEEIAALQVRRRELADAAGAFYGLGSASNGSRTLLRALLAVSLLEAQGRGARADSLEALRAEIVGMEDHPADLEEELLRLRLDDMERYLGPADPLVVQALGGRSVEGAAASLLQRCGLSSQEEVVRGLVKGLVTSSDPAVALAMALAPRVAAYEAADRDVSARERELAADLGRARFEVYGTDVAPDATSSPRITDGVVIPYEYNETVAPTHTRFYGVYDRYYGHQGNADWARSRRGGFRCPRAWTCPRP